MTLPSKLAPAEPAGVHEHLVLSRRTLLRSGGLLAGGVGATAFLAACSAAGAPAWTFPSAAAATEALGAGSASPAATASPAPTITRPIGWMASADSTPSRSFVPRWKHIAARVSQSAWCRPWAPCTTDICRWCKRHENMRTRSLSAFS